MLSLHIFFKARKDFTCKKKKKKWCWRRRSGWSKATCENSCKARARTRVSESCSRIGSYRVWDSDIIAYLLVMDKGPMKWKHLFWFPAASGLAVQYNLPVSTVQWRLSRWGPPTGHSSLLSHFLLPLLYLDSRWAAPREGLFPVFSTSSPVSWLLNSCVYTGNRTLSSTAARAMQTTLLFSPWDYIRMRQ